MTTDPDLKALHHLRMAGILFGILCLIALGYIYAFGIPNFEDHAPKRKFCLDHGGMPIEPHRESYNNMLCIFSHEGKGVRYGIREITNPDWKEITGFEHDYCIGCWDSDACRSPHTNILRERGLHC